MKLLTIIFQSPTFSPKAEWERLRNSLATELLQEDSCLYKLFSKLHIYFQCSQRYFVLYFWNTKILNILFKLSISWVSNKMDTSCKLLADKRFVTLGATRHPPPVELLWTKVWILKYLIKLPALVVFNSSPKFLETVFRWEKQTPRVQLNIQVFLKRICLSLKLGSGTFSFFPLVLNHITYQHTCAQRIHIQTHRRALSLTWNKRKAVCHLVPCRLQEARQPGEAMPTHRSESTPETLKGQRDVHRTEASLTM